MNTKLKLIIFGITGFLIANTYYDGKFTEYLMKGKKYYKMATFGFVGLSIYLFVNKNPGESKNLLKGNLELDSLKQLCFWKNKIIELTVAEFNLINCLAKHPGVVKDRNQLMDAMYGDSIYVDDRTIDSHIKRLRKKFRLYDSSFDQIRTRYGLGYSWRE